MMPKCPMVKENVPLEKQRFSDEPATVYVKQNPDCGYEFRFKKYKLETYGI